MLISLQMVAGTGGLFGWASWAVCFAYTYSQNNDNTLEENQLGAESERFTILFFPDISR